MKIIFSIIISILLIGFVAFDPFPDAFSEPTLHVDDLVVETYVPNLCCMITTMTFVDNDILFLQIYNNNKDMFSTLTSLMSISLIL